jgi:hypothetical protein
MRWLGGIYSLPTTYKRWLNSAGDGRTEQSGVRHVSATIRVRSWSNVWTFVVLLHQTVRCALTSVQHCSSMFLLTKQSLVWRESLLRWLTRQFGGTPDSSVNYSGVRPWNSWEWLVHVLYGLVHLTLSGGTPDSPLRHFSAHSSYVLHFLLWPSPDFSIGLFWTLCTCKR